MSDIDKDLFDRQFDKTEARAGPSDPEARAKLSPRLSFNQDSVTALMYAARFLKPKRFVDLLAEGVGFIADCDGDIWRVRDNFLEMYLPNQKAWVPGSLTTEMFKPANPAQNPEPKKKKVVYSVLMQYKDKNEFYVTAYKYESLEECRRAHMNNISIRLIEESREEISV